MVRGFSWGTARERLAALSGSEHRFHMNPKTANGDGRIASTVVQKRSRDFGLNIGQNNAPLTWCLHNLIRRVAQTRLEVVKISQTNERSPRS